MVINTPFGTLSQEFDKMFQSLSGSPVIGSTNYPPYNVIKAADDEFWLEFAVAGFSKGDIKVTTKENILTITGERNDAELPEGASYVHKGIATRKFTRTFSLPDWFEVNHAGMEDGILYVNLHRNVPEEKKPKEIEIH